METIKPPTLKKSTVQWTFFVSHTFNWVTNNAGAILYSSPLPKHPCDSNINNYSHKNLDLTGYKLGSLWLSFLDSGSKIENVFQTCNWGHQFFYFKPSNTNLNNDYNKEQNHAKFAILNLQFVVANCLARHGKFVPNQWGRDAAMSCVGTAGCHMPLKRMRTFPPGPGIDLFCV